MTEPELVVLAGPNGVGKTTFAKLNLSSFIDQGAFLNADDIARDVNPSDVEAVAIDAGRQMLSRRKDFLCDSSTKRHQPVIGRGFSFSSHLFLILMNCA